jgi:hypothetical protein
MAEAEREEIETDFVRTKVKATQRSIDEPPSIDIGMFDLDVDLLDGRQLRQSPEVAVVYPACVPTRATSYCAYAQTDDDAQKSTDSRTSSSSDAETASALTIGLDELQEDEIVARLVACLEALN